MKITRSQLRSIIREAVRSGPHPSDWNPMSYDEEVAAALQQKKANFKIDIHPRRMGRIGGSVDFPGGKLVQFDMRDLGDGVVLLVMEAMGPEETGEWYGDESVELPATGDPSNDADLAMRQLVTFIEKHRDDLGY